MHSICHTHVFVRNAARSGLTEADIEQLENILARDPTAGEEMRWTGGCRKLRLPGRGKGKSGGYRVITFFTGPNMPVFLIAAFGKGVMTNLTRAQCNALAILTKQIVAEYKNKIAPIGAKRR